MAIRPDAPGLGDALPAAQQPRLLVPSDAELSRRYARVNGEGPLGTSAEQLISAECWRLARMLREQVPAGREAALAQTKLQELHFWALEGIALAPREPVGS